MVTTGMGGIGTNSRGWQTKFVRGFFLDETSIIRDALATLSMLSVFLQSDSAKVVTAVAHVEVCSEKLVAMNEANGQHLAKFLDSFKADGTFMGIAIVQDATDEARFRSLRAPFFTASVDNICQRFPATALMKAASVLYPLRTKGHICPIHSAAHISSTYV